MREPNRVQAGRIPSPGPRTEEERDLFGDFRHLVRLWVGGRERYAPEPNDLLRALQFLWMENGQPALRWGRFCWNNTEACCEVRYRVGPRGAEKRGRACRLPVCPDLELLALPEGRP